MTTKDLRKLVLMYVHTLVIGKCYIVGISLGHIIVIYSFRCVIFKQKQR